MIDRADTRPVGRLLVRGTATAPAIFDRPPLTARGAAMAVLRSVLRTPGMLARREIHQPTKHLGTVVAFDDGSEGRVYRETVVGSGTARDPAVLVVAFRLRWVRGRGHRWFRAESLLNTPLFVGFAGLASKLWLAADERGTYRGVYQWDGADLADAYARALWWVLALVCERRSIHYAVLPGVRRDDLLQADRAA